MAVNIYAVVYDAVVCDAVAYDAVVCVWYEIARMWKAVGFKLMQKMNIAVAVMLMADVLFCN